MSSSSMNLTKSSTVRRWMSLISTRMKQEILTRRERTITGRTQFFSCESKAMVIEWACLSHFLVYISIYIQMSPWMSIETLKTRSFATRGNFALVLFWNSRSYCVAVYFFFFPCNLINTNRNQNVECWN